MTAWKSQLFCTAFNKLQLPPSDEHEIVIVGRSNVGKSTLINALLGCKIARVSSKPGKTRSINFYKINSDSREFTLVDIPGYGYASRGMSERNSWWKLIEDYFNSRRNITFVIHLIDFRHGMLPNDEELTAWLDEIDMPRLIVFTKGDKISPGKRKGYYQKHVKTGINSVLPPFITCGKNDKLMGELREGILDIITEIEIMDRQANLK